jgi:hypothetical protein
MSTSARASFYDLFKLIVAILLLLLFLFLIWGQKPQPSLLNLTTSTTPHTTLTVATPSSTSAPLTATLSATSLPTATSMPTFTSTVIPSPTESPVPETLPTPIVEIPSDKNVCEAISRSQLQVGMKAIIVHIVNFRSSPGVLNNWILTNNPNTQVEVIGGPACTRYKNGGTYLWWQIKLPNGLTGWSAEASAFGAFYFMEPVK